MIIRPAKPIEPAVTPPAATPAASPGAEPTRRLEIHPPAAQTPPQSSAAEPTRRLQVQQPAPQPPPQSSAAEPTRRLQVQQPASQPPAQPSAAEPTRRLDPATPATRPLTPDSGATIRIDPSASPTMAVRPPANTSASAPTVSIRPNPATAPTVAVRPPAGGGGQGTPPPARPGSPATPVAEPVKRRPRWTIFLFWGVIAVVGLFFLGLMGITVGYIYLASQIPSTEELRSHELNFASSRILDRDGNLLYEAMDANAGRRTYVPISQISKYLQQATIATEDRYYNSHIGFDPFAIGRSIYYAILEGNAVSGASTITQQVARNVLLTPEERVDRSLSRKIKEIILAAELNRRYTKDEILEIYLNNNNYGNLAYGIDAAARTYFGTNAAGLTIGQAAFLAGIPQSPAVYDPYHGGLDAVLKRQRIVLSLMVEDKYITEEQSRTAEAEIASYPFTPTFTDRIPAPHFVFYVRQWAEQELGPAALYQGSGLIIHTTLDSRIQNIAQEEVTKGVANLQARNVSNGALVAIEPATGHILALVGSADFYNNDIGGQVNVILRCRQPGSSIKPLTYLAAFEKGWAPATIAWDLPAVYTDTAGNVYQPVNYDGQFRGPVTIRTALANSLNIPAVKALEFVSVDGLLNMAERLGATSIVSPQLECPDYPYENRPAYGLALTLGGGEMKPLEITAAYATFANAGIHQTPSPILYIEDGQGNIILDNRQPQGKQAISTQLAYLITHILSDTQARCLVYHCPSQLELPDRPVAAKTGTTNDFRDSWTVGYTPDLAIGVWVGNNDNSPMDSVAGSAGAAPIWHNVMARALEGTPAHPFPRPQGIIERQICTMSGTEASPYCPERRTEVFDINHPPLGAGRDWVRQVDIDRNSNLRANDACKTNIDTKVMVVLDDVLDPAGQEWMRKWAAEHNYEIAPTRFCANPDDKINVQITRPGKGETISGRVDIFGTVDIPDFDHYEVTYGIGESPIGFGWVSGPHTAIVHDNQLSSWDTSALEPGVYTLRVVAFNKSGAQFEGRVIVTISTPTPTPTISPTPTLTPPPTVTPAPATPTFTPEPITPTPTFTPEPPTPTFTPEPTWTPESPIPTPPPM